MHNNFVLRFFIVSHAGLFWGVWAIMCWTMYPAQSQLWNCQAHFRFLRMPSTNNVVAFRGWMKTKGLQFAQSNVYAAIGRFLHVIWLIIRGKWVNDPHPLLYPAAIQFNRDLFVPGSVHSMVIYRERKQSLTLPNLYHIYRLISSSTQLVVIYKETKQLCTAWMCTCIM